MEAESIDVLIRVDADGRIAEINSSAFVEDTEGWVKIDEGEGDKYHHAQANYLSAPLMDMSGRLLWRWTGEKVVRIPQEELPQAAGSGVPTMEERMAAMEGVVMALMMGGDA